MVHLHINIMKVFDYSGQGKKDYRQEYYFDTPNVEVLADNAISEAKQALELLNIPVYEIKVEEDDQFFGGKVVYRSPILDEIDARLKKEKDEYNVDMAKLCEQFNALPKAVETRKFGKITVKLIRSKATYDPSYSSKLRGYVYFEIFLGSKGMSDLHPSEFITSDGRVQKKKFYGDLRRFGLRELSLTNIDDVEALINSLKELKELKWQYKRKYILV